ncbi:ATP-binding protein [Bacteroidia bacterium]|nr:ATP-binding protein [Bacteroidia bacterium]
MDALLASVCKELRLGTGLASKAKKLAARHKNPGALDFLLELLKSELDERTLRRRNAYQKAAKFDVIKTFEDYTFEDIVFPKTIAPQDLMDAAFVPRKENLVLYGNPGAGKTHLATAIGIAACDAGYRTRFWRVPNLVNALVNAKKKGDIITFMRQFSKLDLLICDEWGYVPIDIDGSKLLFNVVAEFYERRSLIITTNLEFASWNNIFADAKLTSALLDRVIHHSHILDFTKRDSRRLLQALSKQT